MRKSKVIIISFFIVLTSFFASIFLIGQVDYSNKGDVELEVQSLSGKGTQSDPFLITTGQQFYQAMSYDTNYTIYAKLQNDITVDETDIPAYQGGHSKYVSFNGNYKQIKVGSYHSVKSSNDCYGLWCCAKGIYVYNLKIIGEIGVGGGDCLGVGIVGGVVNNATFENCYIDVSISVTRSNPDRYMFGAGLVGYLGDRNPETYAEKLTVKDTCFYGTIKLNSFTNVTLNHWYGRNDSEATAEVVNSSYDYLLTYPNYSKRYSKYSDKTGIFDEGYKSYSFNKENYFVTGGYDYAHREWGYGYYYVDVESGNYVYSPHREYWGSNYYWEYEHDFLFVPYAVQIRWLINRHGVQAKRLDVEFLPNEHVSGTSFYYYTDDWDYKMRENSGIVELTLESFGLEDYYDAWYEYFDDFETIPVTYYIKFQADNGWYLADRDVTTSRLTFTFVLKCKILIGNPHLNNQEIKDPSIVKIEGNLSYVDLLDDIIIDTSFHFSNTKYKLTMQGAETDNTIDLEILDTKYNLVGWYVGTYDRNNFSNRIMIREKDVQMKKFANLFNTDNEVTIYPVLALKSYNVNIY